MISILTSFKPFRGEDALHQRNALASWRALGADLEIIAFGHTEGLEQIAATYDVQQVADIEAYEGRLPRIDLVFRYGEEHAKYDLLMYINGDNILCPEFRSTVGSIAMEKWVMTGQKTCVDVKEELSGRDAASASTEYGSLVDSGERETVGAMDYYIWRRGSMPPLPVLYLGAAGWDNIVLYHCRKHGVPVIDGTLAVPVLHQNHEYKLTAEGAREAYDGPAAVLNQAKLPDRKYVFLTIDSTHWMDSEGRVRSAWTSPRHAWRLVLMFPLLHRWPRVFLPPFHLAAQLVRLLGIGWACLFRRELFSNGLNDLLAYNLPPGVYIPQSIRMFVRGLRR